MSRAGGLLKGTVIRKSGFQSTQQSRSATPQVASSSTSITANIPLGGGVKDATGKTAEYSVHLSLLLKSMEDQCPVCKSDRYLNPKLRLLVSACYHKMCESCIDRLFTLGPAPCPICNKTLRKLAFMPQTFEDLGVEKEVAVRRRLAKDFNKKREDFPDLKTYNDYLEDVEDITFNLINDIDIAKTEARIAKFRQDNAAIIEANIQRDESYASSLREKEEGERREREETARRLAQEEEEQRILREIERQQLIDKLEHSDKDARKLVAKSRAERLKQQQARAAALGTTTQRDASKAIRTRAAQSTIPDPPHVPLQDDWYAYEDKFTLRSGGYYDPISEAVRRDADGIMRAGGYVVEDIWERAIRTAVAGLDILPLSGFPIKEATPQATAARDVDVEMVGVPG
ncbi:CDK-activating kinase assembly factor [Schizopora paradoxa]|uniref:RNA polymerase II transcription factor B subunit 3 n=1 Tax=Schizopora paradoxa TaxID=27342 RepID=A0A0H2S090_9AGAM|nr:CDK-activating kinase assembly factor [Schizopora paradoxa]